MSRHAVPARDPLLQAVVGWDPPLMTFFGHVSRIGSEDDDERSRLLHGGGDFGEGWHGLGRLGVSLSVVRIQESGVRRLRELTAPDADVGRSSLVRSRILSSSTAPPCLFHARPCGHPLQAWERDLILEDDGVYLSC